MRDKFSELIELGVAKFEYKPIAPEIPEQDILCRTYNNIFSIPSDTHMSKLDDGRYVITGHMIHNQDKWNIFVNSSCWGAVNFTTSGYWCVGDLLDKFNKSAHLDILNGDEVYMVEDRPALGSEMGVAMAPVSYTTTESQIPHPIAEISTTGDVNKIIECFGKDIDSTINNLNESVYIKGNNWIQSNTQIIGYINGKTCILNPTYKKID